jgi:hypothetical protein
MEFRGIAIIMPYVTRLHPLCNIVTSHTKVTCITINHGVGDILMQPFCLKPSLCFT